MTPQPDTDPAHAKKLADELKKYESELRGRLLDPETKKVSSEPLVALLVRLKELALAAGFTQGDAARRLAPPYASPPPLGKTPPLHVVDEKTRKFAVSRQRVSEQLSPRDGVRPPLQELVEAFITLYVGRTGDDHGRIRREINELYRVADQTAEEVKARRQDAAEAAGLRHPTPTELQDQRDKARIELDKAEAGRRQVQARHDEIVATVARTNENQAQQIKALHAEQVELQQQLRGQDTEMARLREQFEAMSRRAGRARAEADRAQAEAASARPNLDQDGADHTFGQVMSLAAPDQLATATSDGADGVRQDRDPDSPLTVLTEVRITPETSSDREQWIGSASASLVAEMK